jgi:diguanylate cyclase
MLTRIFELTGISFQLFGMDLYVTIYVPMLVFLPMSLLLGFWWAAIPAYLSTTMVALLGQMPLYWIAVFALANPIGLAMLTLIYRIFPIEFSLRTGRSFWVFVVAVFLASLAGSIGSFIWTYTNQVNLHDFFRVWQGWWLGGFLQAMLFCAPVMWFITKRVLAIKTAVFKLRKRTETRRSTIKFGVALITVVLILFTWLAFKVSMMNVKDQVDMLPFSDLKSGILSAVQVIEFPITIYVFILGFIGYFVFYFIDYWTLRLQTTNDELKANNNRLYQMTIKDQMTQAYNRSYWFKVLEEQIEVNKKEGGELAVMILDLDHFKRINDRYGHQMGDQVLKSFTNAVHQHLKHNHVFARFGGEEFVLMSPNTSSEETTALAAELNDLTRNLSVKHGDQLIRITVSVGCLHTSNMDLTSDQMVEIADQALYHAKANGRDQFVLKTRP